MTVLLLTLLLAAALAEQVSIGSDGGVNSLVMNEARSGCEYPFEPVGNGCYFYSEEVRNFEGAKKACESLGHGYDVTLAMFDINSGEDEAVLMTAASKHRTFWVGGNTEDGLEWKWADERPIYSQAPIWYHDEPKESQEPKCLVAKVTTDEKNQRSYLYSDNCDAHHDFICQVGCPFEYKRVGRFCYFFSEEEGMEMVQWQTARDYCQSMATPGGYHADLVVLGLDDQDDYRLINTLVAGYSGAFTWLGATAETSCVFKYIDGRSLTTSSHYWYYSEPTCEGVDPVYFYTDTASNRTYLRENGGVAAFICQMYKD